MICGRIPSEVHKSYATFASARSRAIRDIQQIPQSILPHPREADKNVGIFHVVIGNEEWLGIALDEFLSLLKRHVQNDFIQMQPNRELLLTFTAAVPYEVLSSTPGSANARRRTVS
jgi:hypothetical protein